MRKPVVNGRPRLLNSFGCHGKCFLSYVITSLRVLQFIEGLVERQPDILVPEIPLFFFFSTICPQFFSACKILESVYFKSPHICIFSEWC